MINLRRSNDDAIAQTIGTNPAPAIRMIPRSIMRGRGRSGMDLTPLRRRRGPLIETNTSPERPPTTTDCRPPTTSTAPQTRNEMNYNRIYKRTFRGPMRRTWRGPSRRFRRRRRGTGRPTTRDNSPVDTSQRSSRRLTKRSTIMNVVHATFMEAFTDDQKLNDCGICKEPFIYVLKKNKVQ